jgi:hypothetical protein
VGEKLVDPSRHVAVLQTLPHAVGWFWAAPLVLLACQVAGSSRDRDGRIALALVLMMLAGYYLVYVTTPHPQTWHVETSLPRLLAQLWPLGVLGGFAAAARTGVRGARRPSPIVA